MFQEEGDPMLKYNQMIARKMMHNTEAYCKAFPSPQLFGGRRLRTYIQSDGGLANAYPSTLAVRNNRANLQFGSNGDSHLEGGNHLKKFNKWYASLADKVKPVNNINGSGRRRRTMKMDGGSGFTDFFDDMASRLKPVVQPISEAFTKKAVEKINGAGRKPNKRGEIVKKIMKEKGLNLPMASKYVKEHNLYRP